MKQRGKMYGKGRRLTAILLAIALIIGMLPNGTVAYAAKKLKLNKKTVTLQVGSKTKLKVKNTKKKVTWKSSNKKIAKVNKKGKVTAVKKGTAKITAKVAGKKLTCKVKVVSKKQQNSTTTQSSVSPKQDVTSSVSATTQVNTAQTPANNTPATTEAQNNNSNNGNDNKKDDGKKDDDKKEDTKKPINLSDVSFSGDYSTDYFVTSMGMPVQDYNVFSTVGECNSDEQEDCIDLDVYGFEFINKNGEKDSFKFHVVKNGSGYLLKNMNPNTNRMKIGSYDIFYNGLYFGSITKEDFTNLSYDSGEESDEYSAELKLECPPLVKVSGQITSEGKLLTEGYVIVKQKVGEKENTKTIELVEYLDYRYEVTLIDGYTYTLVPMGVQEEAITVQVSGGKVDSETKNIDMKTPLLTVPVTLEGFDKNMSVDKLELHSGQSLIKVNDVYDEEEECMKQELIAPAGSYDVYYDGYVIQKKVKIAEDTKSITITNPTYQVILQLDGQLVELSNYDICQKKKHGGVFEWEYEEEIKIPEDAATVEVGYGTYKVYRKGDHRTCIGEFTADADTVRDEEGNLVWNIKGVAVTLKNFDTVVDPDDYIIKEDETGELVKDTTKLYAGTYTVYENTEEGEGEKRGHFEIAPDDVAAGTAIWQMKWAELSGRIEIPASMLLGNEYITGIEVEIRKNNEEYGVSKTIELGTPEKYTPSMPSPSNEPYYYINYDNVKLEAGTYKFVIRCPGLIMGLVAVVDVQEEKMTRDIIGRRMQFNVDTSIGTEGITLELEKYQGYVLGGGKQVSMNVDKNSVYNLYVEDSAGTRQKALDDFSYEVYNGKSISIDPTLSLLHKSTFSVDPKYSSINIRKGSYGSLGSASVKDGTCTIQLFEDGAYTVEGSFRDVNGQYCNEKVGTLTLENGNFQYTPGK